MRISETFLYNIDIKYFLIIFLYLFTIHSNAEDIKEKIIPLTKIFKDKTKDRIFTMGIRCSGLSVAIDIASKEFPGLINKNNPEQFTKQAKFFINVAILLKRINEILIFIYD